MAEWSKALVRLKFTASLEQRHRFEFHSVTSIFRVFVSFSDQDIHNECLNTYTRRFLQITELFSILINKLKAPNLFTYLKLLGCIRQIKAFIPTPPLFLPLHSLFIFVQRKGFTFREDNYVLTTVVLIVLMCAFSQHIFIRLSSLLNIKETQFMSSGATRGFTVISIT